jgi:2-dehydropantoate 2-reductase
MRIYIIGPGAMGLLFAACLREGGLEVALLDYRRERAERLNRSGIFINGVRGERQVKVPVHLPEERLPPPDLVMLWVKSYRTREALEMFRSTLGPATLILTAQNGIGNLEAISTMVPPENVLAGTTTIGANIVGPGRVHHAAEGETLIGELAGGISPRVESICRVLSEASLPTRPIEDIRRALWEKLAVNAAINPLTALLRVRNGELLSRPAALRLMAGLVREVVEAARRQGIQIDEAACFERVKLVARATAANRSSMLQDVEAGRRTEIDAINGLIAASGEAPLNQVVAELVRALSEPGAPHEERENT